MYRLRRLRANVRLRLLYPILTAKPKVVGIEPRLFREVAEYHPQGNSPDDADTYKDEGGKFEKYFDEAPAKLSSLVTRGDNATTFGDDCRGCKTERRVIVLSVW